MFDNKRSTPLTKVTDMTQATENPNLHFLWPTPFLRVHCPDHKTINPALVKLFTEHRQQRDKLNAPVYSSSDDLLMRYNQPELNQLFKFISERCCFKSCPFYDSNYDIF